MGVHGLWKLIEPAGKPVPVETLDSKILAVDVSIWLHQMMKGYQTPAGASVANAYLLGLFTRTCKLLFTNVKPVFVFDGGVPQLKRKTIAARQQQKSKSEQASEKIREQLLRNLLKQKAVSQVLEEIRGQTSPKKKAPDMFELPPLPEAEESGSDVEQMSQSSSEEDVKPIKMKFRDLHTINVHSEEFKSLPADMRHDILTELKETRKESSWGRIHEMPEESKDFSQYQMSRLLKRRSVQVSLEEAEKEMGGRTLSLMDVEALMAEGGIEINPQLSKRIASDDVTRYIYVTETGEQAQTSQNISRDDNEKSAGSSAISSLDPDVKIKEEVIDCDELSDTELMREVEAIEAAHIKIKDEKLDSELEEENGEFGTEDIFENDSSSEGVIMDEMDLIKDSSGLSQQQILAIIKQQNQSKNINGNQLTNDGASTSRTDLFEDKPNEDLEDTDLLSNISPSKIKTPNLSKTVISESKILDSLWFKFYKKKIQSGLSQKSKHKTGKQSDITVKKNNKCSTAEPTDILPKETHGEHLDLSALASNPSESENEEAHNLPCQVSSLISPNIQFSSQTIKLQSSNKDLVCGTEKNNGLEKQPSALSSSESDDDFVDVSPVENEKSSQEIHIEIHPAKDKLEDDIFADIFLDNKNEISALSTVDVQLSDGNKIITNKNNLSEPEKLAEEDNNKDKHTSNYDLSSDKQNKNTDIGSETPTISLVESNVTITDSNVVIDGAEENPRSSVLSPIEHDTEDSEDIDDPESAVSIVKRNYLNDIEDSKIETSKTDLDDKSFDEKDSEPHASTSSDSTGDAKPKRKLNTQQLEKLKDILETKERELVVGQNKEDRMAASITDQMYQEAQELLRLFGVPFVVAPMEAEAQCAFMDAAGLTQGTITDDSDIWLFGGRKVYKNFFDQKKFVLEFQDDNIQQYFKLDRGHLVCLALLVGSDYTQGLQGVGPVTALEILATFPPPHTPTRDPHLLLSSLLSFKQWLQTSAKTHISLAKKLRNVDLHEGFPSAAVVTAYLQPVVDDSREPFSWGAPDLPGLRDFAERKFGWSRDRTDQILLPVVNRLSQKTSQLTLHTFFGAVPNISAHREQMSRRVQTAVNRLEGRSEAIEAAPSRPRTTRGRGSGRGRGRGKGQAVNPVSMDLDKFVDVSIPQVSEFIHQREKDKEEALKRKQQAIDIIKTKKKKGLKRKNIRQVKPDAGLSESSSDDN